MNNPGSKGSVSETTMAVVQPATSASLELLEQWNNTRVDFPLDTPLHRFIEEQVERTPDTVALVTEAGSLTYGELNRRANQLAHYLQTLGVGPDTLVGVCAERSIEMVVALLGTLKAGGAYVPFDPEYPKERLQTMLDDAKPPVMLTQEHLLHRVPMGTPHLICLDRDWHALARERTTNLRPEVSGKNLAYAIYTSGSTGKPKGVANVHEGIVNRLLWMQAAYQLTEADRVLQKTPYSFDVSVWEFFWPLMTGARLVMARPGGHRDPYFLSSLIADEQITTLHFVPSMLRIFLDARVTEKCSSVRRVFVSGEALPFDLQQRFFRVMNCELHNLYGPTEAAVDVTYWQCQPNASSTIVPIGRPIANTQIYILDENLQPVDVGTSGELHIGGVGLARGYLNLLELTASKFIPNPFSQEPGSRLYKTGDLARFLPDGNIEYLGRIDTQVKLRGFRIELSEIESVLNEWPAVQQAVVVMREDTPGDQRLVAYLVPSRGKKIDVDGLRWKLRYKLPEYMVPSHFVTLHSLPMTTSGKIDRRALPVPLPAARRRDEVRVPRSEMERKIAAIFAKVLGIETVSIADDFFDTGGNSLSAVQLIASIEEATGKHIPLSVLLRCATPEYIAFALEQSGEWLQEPTAALLHPGDWTPPFFAVVPPGENAVGYVKMAREMGNYPFYKLQGPGKVLEGRPYSASEMQALAHEYVEAMRATQPKGPYYFGGMCDGAHIALRMAQILELQQEQVGMVAIFDTWVLENTQRPSLWRMHYYWERLKRIATLPTREQIRTVSTVVKNVFRGLPKENLPWQKAYWPGNEFVPPTFGGRITLFKRPRQPYYYVDDPTMGWGERAGSVDIQVLSVTHAEMLHDPHVQILAQRLSERLKYYSSENSASQTSRGEDYIASIAGGREFD